MTNTQSVTPSKSAGNVLNFASSKSCDDQFETWICDAKASSSGALGELNLRRQYHLHAIANRQFPALLTAKLGASDRVQETSLEAHRSIGRLKEGSPDQRLAWLREILLHNLANVNRRIRRSSKRQVSRAISLTNGMGDMGGAGHPHDLSLLPVASPAAWKNKRTSNRQFRCCRKLRDAISVRNRGHLTFVEIGGRLGCSPDAARKHWAPAIEPLYKELVQNHDRNVP